MITRHDQLIRAFGPASRFADDVTAAGSAVSENNARIWRQRNAIPHDFWPAVVRAAHARAILDANRDLASLTIEGMFDLDRGEGARFPEIA